MKTIKNKVFAFMALAVLGMTIQPMFGMQSNQSLIATHVFQAINKGDLSTVKYLINNGINIETKNQAHRTPFYVAFFARKTSIAQYLVEQGAHFDIPGISILHEAIPDSDPNFIKCLVEYGADLTKETSFGTSVEWAKELGEDDIATYLKNAENFYDHSILKESTPENKHLIPDYFSLATVSQHSNAIQNIYAMFNTYKLSLRSPDIDYYINLAEKRNKKIILPMLIDCKNMNKFGRELLKKSDNNNLSDVMIICEGSAQYEDSEKRKSEDLSQGNLLSAKQRKTGE